MLIENIFVKGKPITTLEDMKQSVDGLWLKSKYPEWTEFVIDNPWVYKQWGDQDDAYQDWLSNVLKRYNMWERIKQIREPVFTSEIDNRLDDILSSFAYEYSDCEYHQDEIMESLLKKLEKEFIITRREDK